MRGVIEHDEATYFDCLARRDYQAALDVALAVMDGPAGVDDAMAMLGRAQERVGDMWAANEWSVAQEHAATAITDRVAAALAGMTDEPAIYRSIVVVCVEGEWHTLAARMLSDRLRARRWDVRFLGGSIPARDLGLHLELEPPLALAVSCSIPMFLAGALETIAAAHQLGLPVLAGGRGFGRAPRRADAIGADAWAGDLAAADAVLHRWAAGEQTHLAEPDELALTTYGSLKADRVLIVDHAEGTLSERLPHTVTATARQRERTREDLDYTLQFVEAAVLTDDDTIMSEYVPWLARILASRHVPAGVLETSLSAVVEGLQTFGHNTAADVLARTVGPPVG